MPKLERNEGMGGRPARQFRLRTFVIVVMIVAALLGGIIKLNKLGSMRRHRVQAEVWTGQAAKFRELADAARSQGDLTEAAEMDRRAAHAGAWGKHFEHLASGGYSRDAPPIP